jgi:hypothetical protein
MGVTRRLVGAASAWVLTGMAVAGAANCKGGSSVDFGIAESCSLNSDCDEPLVCVFSRCHTVCATDRDCPTGERCVSSAAGGGPVGHVCQLPVEEACSLTSPCESGQVCGSDDQCRAQCTATGSTACAPGQYCLTSGTTSSCYVVSDPNDQPALMVAGILAPDGAVLVDASSAVLPSSGVDGSSDSTVGSSGSSGGGPLPSCDGGTRLPSGDCDYCPAVACNGSGTCVSGAGTYTCTCYGGYVHDPSSNDPTTCVVLDSCLADNQCSPAYPCVDTAPPGQACEGQFATWHVTDAFANPDAGATELPRYANNGDGTITDAVTTLMWQLEVPQKSAGCAVEPDAGPDAALGPNCALQDSEGYCAALTVGGYDDWRVPTLIELESLLDFSQENTPYIGSAFLPAANGSYWTTSAEESAAAGSAYWYVDFSTTSAVGTSGPSNSAGSVRCVRGTGISPATAPAHYTINPGAIDAGYGDAEVTGDTVTDNYTGLTWERAVGPYLTQPDAIAYCEALGDGFRLPALKELMTLIDPTKYSPAIDLTAFPGTPGDDTPYQTSTFYQPPNGDYYLIEFNNGTTSYVGQSGNTWHVRCVH